MAEYIKREAVTQLISTACAECRESCEEFDGFYADCNQCVLHGVKEKMPQIPAADVREVVRGKWILKNADGSWRVDTCSACGKDTHYVRYAPAYDFCPNCGAKMEVADA